MYVFHDYHIHVLPPSLINKKNFGMDRCRNVELLRSIFYFGKVATIYCKWPID